jgi:dihydroorotate dehydrogenase (fumarate)
MVVGVNTYLGIGASALVRQTVSEMLPGSTRVVTLTVPGVAQLGYLNPYVHMIPTVDKDALNPGPLREIDRDATLFAMPWWLLILVVLAGATWLFIVIRRRRDARGAQAWIEHIEAEAQRKALDERELETAGAPSAGAPSGSGTPAEPK